MATWAWRSLWTDAQRSTRQGRFVVHLIIRPMPPRPRMMGNALGDARDTGGTAFVYRDRVLDVAHATQSGHRTCARVCDGARDGPPVVAGSVSCGRRDHARRLGRCRFPRHAPRFPAFHVGTGERDSREGLGVGWSGCSARRPASGCSIRTNQPDGAARSDRLFKSFASSLTAALRSRRPSGTSCAGSIGWVAWCTSWPHGVGVFPGSLRVWIMMFAYGAAIQ